MFVSSSMTRTEYPMTSLPPSFRADGELDLEDRAPRNVVPGPNRPLVVVREGADDCQAETRPPFLAGKIRLEQTVPVSRRDSRPVVAHGHPDCPQRRLVPHPHHDPAPVPQPRRRVLPEVGPRPAGPER